MKYVWITLVWLCIIAIATIFEILKVPDLIKFMLDMGLAFGGIEMTKIIYNGD